MDSLNTKLLECVVHMLVVLVAMVAALGTGWLVEDIVTVLVQDNLASVIAKWIATILSFYSLHGKFGNIVNQVKEQ